MDTHSSTQHEESPPIADRLDADPSFVGRWLPLLLLALITAFTLHACLTAPVAKRAEPAAAAFDPTATAQRANTAALAALAGLGPQSSAGLTLKALNLVVINFADGSSDLPPDGARLVAEAARAIGLLPADLRLTISGHTDNRGAADANLALSRQRAETVRDALIAAGIAPERLATRGVGDSIPVARNTTEEGRFRNRRIEFSLAP